jgi:hypothetical protein
MRQEGGYKMAIKTRFFGKKVTGRVLEALVHAMGQSRDSIYCTRPKWSLRDVHGKAGFSLEEDGLKVDLYIIQKQFHVNDGSLTRDKKSLRRRFYETNVRHLKGEIKYPEETQ